MAEVHLLIEEEVNREDLLAWEEEVQDLVKAVLPQEWAEEARHLKVWEEVVLLQTEVAWDHLQEEEAVHHHKEALLKWVTNLAPQTLEIYSEIPSPRANQELLTH